MTRVAVLYPGDPRSPSAWSGTPAGLIRGLEELGVEVAAFDVRPPKWVRALAETALAPLYARAALPHPGRVFALADMGPETGTLRGRVAARALRRAGRLDGVVQIGTDFPVAAAAPVATIVDRTLSQALATGYPRWLAMPDRSMAKLAERERLAFDRATACCPLTHWAADSVVGDLGVDPAKVRVVGLGANNAPPRRTGDWSAPRFLFVGLEWERKRGPAVVEAFARVRERHSGATLDVVGRHPPLSAPGVHGHGVSPGAVVAELLAQATCLVVPSEVEPAGIVYLEAASAGVPSIGTTVGGAATMIGDGGRLVAPDDPRGLTEAMLELADPATARAFGERARERSELLTWRAMAERVLGGLGLDAPGGAPLAPPL